MFMVNGGDAMRSFTHIEDASEALAVLLERPEARGQAYNIGNPGNDISIRGLALLMSELYEEIWGLPSKSELVDISGEQFYGEGYEDSGRVPPSIAKLGKLGWSPTRDLPTTLRDAMQFYHDNPQPFVSPAEYYQGTVHVAEPSVESR
jgi:UDP-apiose/xylose synthase